MPPKTNSLSHQLYEAGPDTLASVHFTLESELTEVEVIAVGTRIRELRRIEKLNGSGRWRKLKGVALIRLCDGPVVRAEIHWYEAHGVGRRELESSR
jgi:hypothetical protein